VFDDTLKAALAVQLSQSPFLDIVPDERVRETLQMMTRHPTRCSRTPCARGLRTAGRQGHAAGVHHAAGPGLRAHARRRELRAGESIASEQQQVDSKEKV